VPAPHPPEFRHRAVELARLGAKPVAKIAGELGISESCLRNWMHQADTGENGAPAGWAAVIRQSWLTCGAVTGGWSSRMRS
jgi:transposase-like protein